MNDKHLLLIAILAVGGFILYKKRAPATPAYAAPAATPAGTVNQGTAAQVVSSAANITKLISGIYGKIGSSGSTDTSGQSSGSSSDYMPDDSLAVNPPASIDPYAYESAAWSGDL